MHRAPASPALFTERKGENGLHISHLLKRRWASHFGLFLLLLLTACSTASPSIPTLPASVAPATVAIPTTTPLPTRIAVIETAPAQTKPALPTAAPTLPPTPAPTTTLAPDAWQQMPVIPTLSPRALEIYRRGLELGNNPYAFSKIGDCESTPTWFLADFDKGTRYYNLGDYTNLQPVIDYFAGSYERTSLAVKPGFTATSVMTPLWADPKQCEKDESPLACEYRLHKPAFAIIMLGSNNTPRPERFEPQMRKILDETIARGIVPVLVTKADNLEGNHAINAAIGKLAYEYDIPLWNFWLAVQPLPHHGLQDDGAHLTWAPSQFNASMMKMAWPWRNLTALQTLDAMMKAVQQP